MPKEDALEREITGDPVTVAIRGSLHPLSYRMYNVIVYKQRSGDSLFDPAAWPKIDLATDPERWLACLWAGLHEQQPDSSWKVPYTIEQLGALVDFCNAGEISRAMVRAMMLFLPRSKDGEAPKTQDAAVKGEAPTSLTSPSSGPELVAGTDSPATNS